MSPKIQPQILKGMRDFLPARMILRDYVVSVLKDTFERFGFEPLQTPAIEYAETLEGKSGEEADRLMYKFEDRGGRRVGLRYELTVSLARVVAQYPDIPKPFKRYQIAPVWRAERPQKGRYREFYQCDVDTVGTRSMLADAEFVSVVADALGKLGFDNYRVKINNRKLLRAIALYVGVPPAEAGGIYRAIDKLDKIGVEGVEAELAAEGLDSETIGRLLSLLESGKGGPELLESLRRRLAHLPDGAEGLHELEKLLEYVRDAGVPQERYLLDLTMVRGLDYYTGPIFEAVVEQPRIGSLAGGGRYDGLIGLFGPQEVPATGISFGLERIIDVMEEMNMAPAWLNRTITHVLVTVFSEDLVGESLRLGGDLRAQGLNTEVYLGVERLGSQLRYASRKGIPYIVVVGPDELQAGKVVLRNMITEEQRTVPRGELAMVLHSEFPQ